MWPTSYAGALPSTTKCQPPYRSSSRALAGHAEAREIAMSWLREFETPIDVDGEMLFTLRDAGEYIAALPDEVSAQAHWQTAMRELLMSAERDGILWLAEVAIRSAIHHGQEQAG